MSPNPINIVKARAKAVFFHENVCDEFDSINRNASNPAPTMPPVNCRKRKIVPMVDPKRISRNGALGEIQCIKQIRVINKNWQ